MTDSPLPMMTTPKAVVVAGDVVPDGPAGPCGPMPPLAVTLTAVPGAVTVTFWSLTVTLTGLVGTVMFTG